MTNVRSLNFGERDATLIDFLLEENSKLAPKACLRNSSSGFSSSYTGSMKSIGRLICEILPNTLVLLKTRVFRGLGSRDAVTR